MNDIKQAST